MSWTCRNCKLQNKNNRTKCQACFDAKPNMMELSRKLTDKSPNASSGIPSRTEMLIHGFIHEQEKKLKLMMDIPVEIILLILNYFPALYRFGLHDETLFTVSDDRLSIKSISCYCSGYMIYADLEDKDDIGLNEGVHIWSLLSNVHPICHRSIGITTIKLDMTEGSPIPVDTFEFIEKGNEKGYHYDYDGT